jgi:hypothetical protein
MMCPICGDNVYPGRTVSFDWDGSSLDVCYECEQNVLFEYGDVHHLRERATQAGVGWRDVALSSVIRFASDNAAWPDHHLKTVPNLCAELNLPDDYEPADEVYDLREKRMERAAP